MNTPFTAPLNLSRVSLGVGALSVMIALSACGPQNGTPVAGQPVPAAPVQTAPQTAPQLAPVAPAPVAVTQPPSVVAAPVPRAVPAEPVRQVARADLGEVQSIEPIRTRPQGSGAGAVIGGVLGAVVGNQFGHGNGKAAVTALGAVGGAVAGNNVERNRNEGIAGYRVSVRLDTGESRTYQEEVLDGLRVGDRVRIEGSRVRRV